MDEILKGFNNQVFLNEYHGDKRLLDILTYDKKGNYKCIYCLNIANSREHIPSKIFLNKKYPEELAVLPACKSCNNSYSNDEQYLACLIDFIQYKIENLSDVKRDIIRKTFVKRPRIKATFEESIIINKDGSLKSMNIDISKIENIVLKLAIGHGTYQLSKIFMKSPTQLNYKFLCDLTDEEFKHFNALPIIEKAPEIGSRLMEELYIINDDVPITLWKNVQENQYRYIAFHSNEGTTVRIVIGEFFFAEVFWKE